MHQALRSEYHKDSYEHGDGVDRYTVSQDKDSCPREPAAVWAAGILLEQWDMDFL